MKTITEQLADALRTIDEHCQTGLNSSVYSNWSAALEDVMRASREALAAYDAQQAQAHDVAAGAWSANAGSVWDHTGKWIADCNREHAARIVQCVNAHDALVSALRTILADKGSASFNHDLEAYDAAIQTASDALAQAGVNHA